MAYADRSGASSGLSTTYGILFFVGFLALCRTVVYYQRTDRGLGTLGFSAYPPVRLRRTRDATPTRRATGCLTSGLPRLILRSGDSTSLTAVARSVDA